MHASKMLYKYKKLIQLLFAGLKSHAVTLYEAGKLGHASISDLCKDLTALEGKKFEGELQEFANHAFSLRSVLECLQSGGMLENDMNLVVDDKVDDKVDLQPSIKAGDGLLGTDSSRHDISVDSESEIKAPNNDELFNHSDPEIPQITTKSEPMMDLVNPNKLNEDIHNEDNISSFEGQTTQNNISKVKKTYLVNILRCESLASLAPSTLDRLFIRDYDIVVSMAPLPTSSVLPGPFGPVHFGPPSYASMTPWMKLVLYTTVSNGPLSVVLMKGQCLWMLPAPLTDCEKALIWSWDGSVTGGLGGKFEGSLVNGNILLHCLNLMLKSSAVLVQPICKYDLDESGKPMTVDIPLPLKNSDGFVANAGDDLGLCLEESAKLNSLLSDLSVMIELWTVGYIRLQKLRKEREIDEISSDNEEYEWVPLSLEFGVPLFSPKLTKKICERVVSSCLLQTDSLDDHHNEMQSLRKRLREICFEYQSTGPTAKIFYHREQPKESFRQLMNFASGRWNIFSEPSTPISATFGGKQRIKLANRQRFHNEVLSFDGNILRSVVYILILITHRSLYCITHLDHNPHKSFGIVNK